MTKIFLDSVLNTAYHTLAINRKVKQMTTDIALQHALNRVTQWRSNWDARDAELKRLLANDLMYQRLLQIYKNNDAPRFEYGMAGGAQMMAYVFSPECKKRNYARRLMRGRTLYFQKQLKDWIL